MKLVVACLMVMIALSSAEDDMLKELDEELLFDILQQKEQKSDNDGNACANKPNGDYADPADCAKYITCSNGQAITDRNCPGGLYFNPKTSACDYPKNVDCKSKGSGDCSDKSDGNYPDPNNCFGFIMCSNGMGYHMNCPSNLKYDKNTKQCEHPDKVVCSASDDVEFATDKRSQLPSKDPFCRNRADGNYVNPYECEGFIMCSNHLTYFFDCPSILQYNPKTDRCDWPRNVNCGPTPKPTKPRPQPPAPTPSPSTFCKNRPNGNYVDPNNCNGFIMCSNHLTYFFDCPSNLRYNAKTDRCDWPRNVKCGPTPAPTAPPTTAAPVTPSPSTFCKYRQNGNYVDPNNCNGFIMCSNHLTYFFDCPANLRYNAKTDRCDWPRNVKCGPTPKPTKPQPPAPTPSPSTFCKNRQNGNYVDPNNCNGFIMCSNHLTYFFDCPANLRYNAKTDRCDWPWNVKCGPTPKPQPPAPTPSPSTFCKNRPNGNYVDPNNCNGFIMCSNHLTYFFDCPANLRYNAKTDRCDWPWNVKCGPTPKPQPPAPTPSPSTFCKNRPNGNYVDPNNCNGFIMCSNHLTYFFDCPSNLRYNAKTDRCDWPRNVKCGPTPKPQPPAPTPSPSTFCKNRPNGNYVDPNNCNGFIMCSNHLTYFFDCPANLRYNAKTDRCDWPRNVKCGPTPAPTKPQPPAPTPSPSTFCKNRPNGNYVDPNNCNGFIMCSNHLTYFFDCPSNLRYNAKTDRCDWPRNVKCGPTPKPQPPAPTPSPSTFCKNRPNGNYVDPNNCNGFIMCSNHLTYFFDCPSNLRYNAKTDRCDWPRNVKCPPKMLSDALRTTNKRSKFCKRHGNGDYRDTTNCEGYFSCYFGYQIFRECPGSKRFNPLTRKCDLPRNVKCGGAGGGTRGSGFCKNKVNGDYKDVLNCNGFIKCSNSYTYYFDCPSILRFNLATDRCDWPRNVRCSY